MDRNLLILVAEDSDDDATLLKRAFSKNGINNPVHVCTDGNDAISYLQGTGKYCDRSTFPFPSVIITDLKMPIRDGFDILQWLQDHPECHVIPVIILSASAEERDVRRAYQLGANAYMQKPGSFHDLELLMKSLFEFWAACVKPPLPETC